jgi:hypothetical protein
MSTRRTAMNAKPEKVPEIVAICERLQSEFGKTVRFNSNWDSQQDAVGVSHPSEAGRLAYICSYPAGYFVSLELPSTPGSDAPYLDGGEHHDLSADEVVRIVGHHLKARRVHGG